MQAQMKRTGYRGVIDVVYGGEKPAVAVESVGEKGKEQGVKGKRKATVLDDGTEGLEEKPISKREQKRRAKKARQEAARTEDIEDGKGATPSNGAMAPESQMLQEPNINTKQGSTP